jgi:CTP synthase (UTP-ammonia lyase)
VQIIPHITDKIIEKVKAASESSKADFVIVEI